MRPLQECGQLHGPEVKGVRQEINTNTWAEIRISWWQSLGVHVDQHPRIPHAAAESERWPEQPAHFLFSIGRSIRRRMIRMRLNLGVFVSGPSADPLRRIGGFHGRQLQTTAKVRQCADTMGTSFWRKEKERRKKEEREEKNERTREKKKGEKREG